MCVCFCYLPIRGLICCNPSVFCCQKAIFLHCKEISRYCRPLSLFYKGENIIILPHSVSYTLPPVRYTCSPVHCSPSFLCCPQTFYCYRAPSLRCKAKTVPLQTQISFVTPLPSSLHFSSHVLHSQFSFVALSHFFAAEHFPFVAKPEPFRYIAPAFVAEHYRFVAIPERFCCKVRIDSLHTSCFRYRGVFIRCISRITLLQSQINLL